MFSFILFPLFVFCGDGRSSPFLPGVFNSSSLCFPSVFSLQCNPDACDFVSGSSCSCCLGSFSVWSCLLPLLPYIRIFRVCLLFPLLATMIPHCRCGCCFLFCYFSLFRFCLSCCHVLLLPLIVPWSLSKSGLFLLSSFRWGVCWFFRFCSQSLWSVFFSSSLLFFCFSYYCCSGVCVFFILLFYLRPRLRLAHEFPK